MAEKGKKHAEIDQGRRKLLKLVGLGGIIGLAAAFRPLTSALLNEKPKESEEFKKALQEVQKIILDLYQNNKPVSLDEALQKAQELSEKIILVLQQNKIVVPDGSNAQTRVMEFFQSNGYLFAFSPILVDAQRYVVNAPLYRIGSTDDFDLSELHFRGLPASSRKIPIFNIVTTLVPDFRETSFFQGERMIFDGMTIQDPRTGNSIIALFPDKIQSIAEKEGLNPVDYKKTVVINEVAQTYFSEIIPNKALGLSLAEFGIDTRGHDWTLHHVNEAFSDFASLKFGNTFRHELTRILMTTHYIYDFSKTIATTSANLGLEKAGLKKQIAAENVKEIIGNLNDKELEIVKKIVIDSYEANIAAVISQIVKKVKK